jgi:hypothetical protein
MWYIIDKETYSDFTILSWMVSAATYSHLKQAYHITMYYVMLNNLVFGLCRLTIIVYTNKCVKRTLYLVLNQSQYGGGERWWLAHVEDPALVSGVGHGIHQGVPENVQHEQRGPLIPNKSAVVRKLYFFGLRMVDQILIYGAHTKSLITLSECGGFRSNFFY